MGVGGKGFVLFARLQPDTPGKLHAHALSYEALELSSSDLLALVPPGQRARRCAARRPDCDRGAHDDAAAGGALRPRRRRVPARGRSRRPDRAAAEVPRRCTRDREQAIALLARGPKLAGSERLATIYDDHLAETRDHAETISARLQALGADPSSLKDSRRATPRRHKRSKGSSSRNARRRSGSPVPSTTRSGPRSRHRKSPARRARESPFRGATATAVSPTMSGLWP